MDEKIIRKILNSDEEILFLNIRNFNNARIGSEVKTITSEFKYKYYIFLSDAHEIKAGEIEISDDIYQSYESLQYEIWKIYTEYKVTQLFLSQIFNVSRPKISLILKDANEKINKKGKLYKNYYIR